MSFRSKQPVAPLRRRSASSLRTPSSTSLSYASSRPRSSSFYSSGISNSPYSSPYSSNSSYGSAGSYTPSSYSSSNYSGYGRTGSSNYSSPYYPNGYRNSSGYTKASLTIPSKPAKTISNVSYGNNYGNEGHRSRQIARSNASTANRERSQSRNRSLSAVSSGGMGSRSMSLTSLNSEGYCSGTEKSTSRSSRIGSTNDLIRDENGEIDYKKLYEQAMQENDRLKDKVRKTDEELRETKQTLEKLNTLASKNPLSELEKRERRAMERKLSEMEEELKQLQKLKAENERLRAENRALTRVVSKLSNSAAK